MYRSPLSERRCLGQLYIAVNIEAFQPVAVFKFQMKALVDRVRTEPRLDLETPILVPGDPEKAIAVERAAKGIPISRELRSSFDQLAQRYRVTGLADAEAEDVTGVTRHGEA